MKSMTKIVIAALCFVAIIISAVLAIAVLKTDSLSAPAILSRERLTAERIEELRTEYPVFYGAPFADSLPVSMYKLLSLSDTVLIAKSTGKMNTYTDSYIFDSSSPEVLVDKKAGGTGIQNVKRFEYEVEVVEDSSGLYKPGAHITLAQNADLEPYLPVLKEGLEFIVPIRVVADQNATRKVQQYFAEAGFYYVVDNGYVLAAFEESQYGFTGLKAESVYKEMGYLSEQFKGKTPDEMSKLVNKQ